MKTTKLFIAIIGILFLFNSVVTGGSLKEEPLEVEQWMTEYLYEIPAKPKIQVIYVDNLYEFKIVSKVINAAKDLFPSEFENIEIRIELGEEFNEQPLQFEDWMISPFPSEEEIVLEKWMMTPFV